MSLSRVLLASLALSTVSTAAFAQDADDGRTIEYKQRTEIDFEDVDVTGELKKPSGVLSIESSRGKFNPLIRLRENFDREMKASIDEVK